MDGERTLDRPVPAAGQVAPGEAQASLDRRLQQAQQLELLGHFASGIAQDMQELVAMVQRTREAPPVGGGGPAALAGQVEALRNAARRAGELTARLQAFARPRADRLTPLDLNELVSRHLDHLRSLLLPGHSLEWRPTLDPLPVRVDEPELVGAVTNLVINASEALPEGGPITLATASERVASAYVTAHPWAREGDFATLTVTDHGIGMAPPVLARAFEPFFSTKGPGRGSGLGLPLVFASIKRQEGMIEISSRVGLGTSVKLFLPRVSAPGRSSGEVAAVSAGAARGASETVLVAEDAHELRHMVARILKALGYRVLEATDGQQALEILRSGAERVDLVLADVVMPRMGGVELFEHARQLQPDLAFLFSSGYAEEDIGSAIPRQPRVGTIPKPYRLDALAGSIRELLDERT